MDARLQKILGKLRAGLERLYGTRLKRVILFGSHARGDADPDSDIDVLVLLEPPVDSWAEVQRTGPLVATLSLRFKVVISCVFDTPVALTTASDAFHRSIQREGIAL
ncbi:MAG TPA: nucleotidyltransferase domain-containing protein [Alphaproteobacteria bacterium]|nr:nucleotidyltransferase domain-containing protein [Alphaproteobacteria bacterium]